MNIKPRSILIPVIIIAAAVFSAICFHSIEEIHYLKSFFPREFTVEEAFYASAIELIKIIIAGVPFLLVIVLCLVFIMREGKGR